jgi:hypothetical protein
LVRGKTKRKGVGETGMEREREEKGMGMGKVDEKAWQRHYRCPR